MKEVSPSRYRGKTYESTYTGWLDFFKELATAEDRVRVTAAPVCWSPFIRYMGHVVKDPVKWFMEDGMLDWPSISSYEESRRQVEISSTCRPELAHALYLWDTGWSQLPASQLRVGWREGHSSKQFVVTCNASYFRKEVTKYIVTLDSWEPSPEYYERQVIVCPCAADKPYPAPLHSAIAEAVPNCYLIVATGVLGLAPEELWPICPEYDAGVPYNERVYHAVVRFFGKFAKPQKVVVYSDFLAFWITHALDQIRVQPYVSVFGEERMEGYLDLMSKENLRRLADACSGG